MPTLESPFIPIFPVALYSNHIRQRIISRDNFRENVKETSINRRRVCICIRESSRSYTFGLIFFRLC